MKYKTYIISDGTAIKIGKTLNHTTFKKRMIKHQTGNPRDIVLLGGFDYDLEIDLHRRFKELNIRGEWFQNDILDILEDHPDYKDREAFLQDLYINKSCITFETNNRQKEFC